MTTPTKVEEVVVVVVATGAAVTATGTFGTATEEEEMTDAATEAGTATEEEEEIDAATEAGTAAAAGVTCGEEDTTIIPASGIAIGAAAAAG